MEIVSSVEGTIDIAMNGGQAAVTSGAATMIVGRGERVFADPDCDHFFDDGFCLLCDEPESPEKGHATDG